MLKVFPWLSHTFAQCRDLEDNYHEGVQEIALATLESVAKDTPEEDMTEDVKLVSVISFRPNCAIQNIGLHYWHCYTEMTN